jgi:GDPmannose 4,6-dehydratase
MWMMLQQQEPDDFVVATGESHSVREFLAEAFAMAGLDWADYVEFDPRYLRPTDVDRLMGDGSKARAKLGWAPKTGFRELIRMMVDHDLELARKEKTLLDAGHSTSLRASV